MIETTTRVSRWAAAGLLLAMLAMLPPGAALAEEPEAEGAWEMTYRLSDADPVTEDWVSMSNSRLFMARRLASTAAIFDAARDGGTLEVTVRGWDPVTFDIPESDDALFDYYVESCDLDPDSDPDGGS